MKLLILGGTGLVGHHAVMQALADPRFERVVAPTRKALEPHARLVNPVLTDLEDALDDRVALDVDAVICALGTTSAKAGSAEAFRRVDFELPLAFARKSRAAGVGTFAVVTAIGASPDSRFPYARLKGELEQELKTIGFDSLTIARPSMIGGDRSEVRTAEGVALFLARVLSPILPRKFHVNPAQNIARALVEAANNHPPGCHYRYAESMT